MAQNDNNINIDELNEEDVSTLESVGKDLAELLTNSVNMADRLFEIFFDPNPHLVPLQLYNSEGNLTTYEIPNRAMDRSVAKSGNGSPEGVVEGVVGTLYIDETTRDLYIKKTEKGNSGWENITPKNLSVYIDSFNFSPDVEGGIGGYIRLKRYIDYPEHLTVYANGLLLSQSPESADDENPDIQYDYAISSDRITLYIYKELPENSTIYVRYLDGLYGIKGDTALTLNINKVNTVSPEQPARVENVGTDTNILLDFDIPQGYAATIEVGTVTTGEAGTEAKVENVGDTSNAVFDFTIPKGLASTLEVGTVTTGEAGTEAKVENVGDTSNAVFDFTIPKGDKGDTGTMEVGEVNTGEPKSDVIITNTGTPEHGIFNFTIPRGVDGGLTASYEEPEQLLVLEGNGNVGPEGPQGPQGPVGPSNVLSIGTVTKGDNAEVEITGESPNQILNFVLPKGDTGEISIGTVQTGEPGESASVINSGTSTNAVLDFVIPKGDKAFTLAVGDINVLNANQEPIVTNVGTESDQVWNMSIPRGQTGLGVDIGTVITSSSNIAPEGFKDCKGEEITKEENPELYKACLPKEEKLTRYELVNSDKFITKIDNGIIVSSVRFADGVTIPAKTITDEYATAPFVVLDGASGEWVLKYATAGTGFPYLISPTIPEEPTSTMYFAFNYCKEDGYVYARNNSTNWGSNSLGDEFTKQLYCPGVFSTSTSEPINVQGTVCDINATVTNPSQLPTCTYEEYETQLAEKNGICGYFGVDTINEKVKLPTLNQIYLKIGDTDTNPYYVLNPYVCVSKFETIAKGTTFTPNVNAEGVISWTNDGGLENPLAINIKGETGAQGEAAFTLQIGTVTTLPAGSEATVTNSGTQANQVWDISIPRGDSGVDIVTILSADSTDQQVPSAKCMYDLIGNIETLLSEV